MDAEVQEFLSYVDKYFEALELLGYNLDQSLQIINTSLDCVVLECELERRKLDANT